MSGHAEWIGVDWGTTNVRAWVVDGDGQIIATAQSDEGMGKLRPEQFEPVLLKLIGDHLQDGRRIPVLCCGMVGARQGWAEAPYLTVPCKPPGRRQAVAVVTQDPRISVSILPGVSQKNPPDVMRGEETQIAGYLLENPDFDGILCLPGTHTKWVHVSAGEIVSFTTYMSGEMFDLLSTASVLRHTVAGKGWDDGAFDAALSDTLSRPQGFAAKLFSLRANELVNGEDPGARARLSGYLLGMELAASKPYWLGQNVVIIGGQALNRVYGAALAAQGVQAACENGDTLVLGGLRAAFFSGQAD